MFRRDANILPPTGHRIAEFDCGQDALNFARMKGPTYHVCGGIERIFAVRMATADELQAAASTLEPLEAV